MFSDLNRFVQKTSKSLDILYDKRDDVAAATLMMIEKVAAFKELTEKEKMSLESKSTKLFTLAALYDANVELLKGYGSNASLVAFQVLQLACVDGTSSAVDGTSSARGALLDPTPASRP